MTAPKLHSLLPAKEIFAVDGAGAVARCVKHGLTGSRFADTATVFGRPLDQPPFDGFTYQPLSPQRTWLRGRNNSLAHAWLKEARKTGLPDLLEVHNRCQMAALIARAQPGLKTILHLHNDPREMKGGRSPRERRLLLENLAGVFTVSAYIRACFLEETGAHESLAARVIVTPNSCDRPAATSTAPHNLISVVGRMVPEKGMLETARAAARVLPRHPDWQIVFIGARGYGNTPPSAYEKEVLAALAPLGGQARMTGYLSETETRSIQQQAAIAIVLSQWQEPAGLTVIEALASGSALITTRRGGIPEYAEGRAVLLDAADADDLTPALDRMIADAAWREGWQQKARDDYPFTVAEVTRRLDAARQQVLDG